MIEYYLKLLKLVSFLFNPIEELGQSCCKKSSILTEERDNFLRPWIRIDCVYQILTEIVRASVPFHQVNDMVCLYLLQFLILIYSEESIVIFNNPKDLDRLSLLIGTWYTIMIFQYLIILFFCICFLSCIVFNFTSFFLMF